MHSVNNKVITLFLATLLVASIGATVLIPAASAHTPKWEVPTFAHIYVAVNPIGVGQTTHIYLFLTPTYPDTLMTNNYRFHNYKLTITAPNGEVTTQSWETVQDTTSNQGYSFTPTQIGTYNLTFNFPGQYVNDYPHLNNSQYENDYFLPSNATTTLTVQEASIPYSHQTPLPTEYWTRPINGENTVWYTIASNWLGSGSPGYGGSNGPNQRVFTDSASGSLTSHVMWTKSLQPGGVVGDDNFDIQANTYFEGTAYTQRYVNPIVVYGRIYYREPFSFNGMGGDTVCVDLRTGQEIWRKENMPSLSFAMIYDLETPNFHGVYPAILFTANFAQAYDAATGKALFNVTDVPTGSAATTVLGGLGEPIRYTFFNNGTTSSPSWYLCGWNSSRLWNGYSTVWAPQTITTANGTVYVSASQGRFYDNLDDTTQNASIPWRATMPTSGTMAPSIIASFKGDMLLCRNGSYPALGDTGLPYTYFAVNLNESNGAIGKILWMKNIERPAGNITTISFAGADAKAGYFAESYRQTQQFVIFNLRTGERVGITDPQPALDYYGSNGPGTLSNVVAYGRIYSSAYAGVLHCYDMATADLLWTYGNGGAGNTTYSGFEVPGPYPTFIQAIGHGVVYLVTSEHTFETPIYKGALARAVNATDGTELWTLAAATGEFNGESYAIADGFSTFFNSYDQQIYSLGRGPSQTTVAAGPKTSVIGNTVVIEGTVTDIAAGTHQDEQAARFPQGVPAASDASMGEWMAYVYEQQSKPVNFTGVDVTLNVIDANGNYRTVGTATTDASGYYSCVWTPDISGKYTVIATFAGNKGYYPSAQETSFNVQDAPATPTPAPTAAPSMSDLYFLPAVVGIILAMIVGFVVLALLMLKKHP